MDLKAMHDFTDEIFNMDKATGDLGKKLSELKDHFTNLHKDEVEKESQIQKLTEDNTLLKTEKEKLIQANGELLMRTPSHILTNPQNYQVQQEEKPSGIESLLGGIEI